MKRLPSSLREKKRYIALEVEGDEPVRREELVRGIWEEVIGLLGEAQASELNLWISDFDEKAQRGFVVCRHTGVGKLEAALATVGELGGRRVHLRVLGIAGTIKALKRKFLNRGMLLYGGERDASFMGKNIKVARVHNSCVEILPPGKEWVERAGELRLRYLGLMEKDLRGE